MQKKLKIFSIFLLLILTISLYALPFAVNSANAESYMPFYNLKPQELTLRAQFYTSFPLSSNERKNNIRLAGNSLNGTFIDVGAEFSFNKTVGARTEKNGYKTAKIIVGGKFVDGVGGGVCQVSTTLYNAVLLAGLKITEYHPHSLPVSYVAPSFDAMVNSNTADLKFINNTSNPIYIKTEVNSTQIKISIYGEKMTEKYVRQSVIVSEIPAPSEQIIVDDAENYPTLYEGETKVISYGKNGYFSEGYLIKYINGKPTNIRKIRKDKYSPVQGVIVQGKAKKTENIEPILTAPAPATA